MTSILEEFAYGNITPEIRYFEKNSKYGRLLELVARNEKQLMERLGSEDKKVLTAYIDTRDEAADIAAVNNFLYGFKLGLTMTAETFLTSGDLIAGGEG